MIGGGGGGGGGGVWEQNIYVLLKNDCVNIVNIV
jgi:hypothetical protein